jgi:hypothetical protein
MKKKRQQMEMPANDINRQVNFPPHLNSKEKLAISKGNSLDMMHQRGNSPTNRNKVRMVHPVDVRQ